MAKSCKRSVPIDPIDQILDYPGARAAFDKLIAGGVDKEWLTGIAMWLQEYLPLEESAAGKLFAKREDFLSLGKKLAALAEEIGGWQTKLRSGRAESITTKSQLCLRLPHRAAARSIPAH